jgi:hypothetical protein
MSIIEERLVPGVCAGAVHLLTPTMGAGHAQDENA